MSHGSSIPLGAFETPDVRLARLRTQFDSTSQSMGDTVTDLVDLEARRRAMEDNLRRFREVEQQQNLQFPQPRPTFEPTATPTPPPDLVQAELRRRAGIQTSPIPAEPTGQPSGPSIALQALEQARTQVTAPIAATGLQVAESPIGSLIPGVAQLKELGRKVEGVGVPEGISPLPRTRTFEEVGEFVNPFAAFAGDKEEQEKALSVLDEAGLPRSLATEIILDPLNLLPGVGFTKIDDLARLVRVATRATGAGKVRAVNALRNSDLLQQARRGLAPEAGGGPLFRGGEERLANKWRRMVEEIDNLTPEQQVREFGVSGDAAYSRAGFGRLFTGMGSATDTARITRQIKAAGSNRAFILQQADKVEASAARVAETAAAPPLRGGADDLAARWREANPVGRKRIEREWLEDRGLEQFKGKWLRQGTDEVVSPQEVDNLLAPLRGGEPPAPPLRGGEEVHIAKGDPGPPPPRKPPARGAAPDDPEFRSIQEVALKGEKPPETLIRRHQGAIDTAKRVAANEVRNNNQELVKIGLGRNFRGSVVAKTEGSFDELNSLLHNPGAVARGERVVPDELRPIYDKLRGQTDFEQAARVDFDPDQALVEDYFFRGWKPPEGMFIGEARGSLGRNPSFRLPRVNATYDEMVEAGFKPLFDNPAEQARYSQVMGIKYREQMRLIEDIKAAELALPVVGGPVPKGWRVPKVGPAFEGKPYADGTRVAFTRRWAVPDSLANRLENVYGVTPDFGKGTLFGKTVEFNKVIDAVTFTPKRFKLVGSLFQHIDFLSRSHIGAWTGFVDAIRRGQPATAVVRLAKWPQSAVDIVHGTFSPNFRARLAKLAVDDTPLWEGRQISNRTISEAGLSLRDETIFPTLDDVIRQVEREPRIVRLGKAPLRALGDLERQWRQGLFEGVYPAAILSDIKNNIGPMIIKQHPEATDAQLAGMIAKASNEVYSTIPASMSVIQNKQARWFLTRFLFSLGENEGLLRSFTGAIRGENAAFFRARLAGTYLGLMALATTIHFATTGKPLPLNRFTPVSKDKFGPLPVGFNSDFASPDLPIKGRGGANIQLDLVMQQDTIFRILNPESFLSSRTSVPVRAIENQRTGKDFFGAPIDTVGPGGIFSRTAQLAKDLFAPIGPGQAGLEILRTNIEETEGLLQPTEGRLGITGIAVQAAGINLRAERTPELLDRIRAEVLRDRGIEGTYAIIAAEDAPLKQEIDDEVEERIGGELEIRGETSKLRGQQTPQSEGFEALEATRERQQVEQLADDTNLNSGRWAGDVWREKYADRQREFFASREQIKEDFQITFDDKAAPSGSVNAAIDTYFDVNVDNFNLPDGTVDWDAFFDARDAALRPLSVTDRGRVVQWLRKFDTPTVTQFRKAKDVVDEVFETPKYVGLSLEEGQEVDRILFEIVPRMQTVQLSQGVELERGQAVMAAISFVQDPDVAKFLLTNFGPRLSVRRRRRGGRRVTLEAPNVVNPERDEILIENQDLLALFYPDLLARQLSREQEAALGETALAAVTR